MYVPDSTCMPCKVITITDDDSVEGTDYFKLDAVVSRGGEETSKIILENPQISIQVIEDDSEPVQHLVELLACVV